MFVVSNMHWGEEERTNSTKQETFSWTYHRNCQYSSESLSITVCVDWYVAMKNGGNTPAPNHDWSLMSWITCGTNAVDNNANDMESTADDSSGSSTSRLIKPRIEAPNQTNRRKPNNSTSRCANGSPASSAQKIMTFSLNATTSSVIVLVGGVIRVVVYWLVWSGIHPLKQRY